MSTAADLPEPTQDEVNHMAEVIADAKLRGIEHGGWSLARLILDAGYRKVSEPEPVRPLATPWRLDESGAQVDPPEAVSTNGR